MFLTQEHPLENIHTCLCCQTSYIINFILINIFFLWKIKFLKDQISLSKNNLTYCFIKHL